jgi:diamine N-acetyltransferase
MTAERSLEVITPENIDEALGVEVRADQSHVVSPVVKSLAEAHAFGQRAWPRLIRCDGQAVGFLMAFFDFDFNVARPAAGPDLRSGRGGSTSLRHIKVTAMAVSPSTPSLPSSVAAAPHA